MTATHFYRAMAIEEFLDYRSSSEVKADKRWVRNGPSLIILRRSGVDRGENACGDKYDLVVMVEGLLSEEFTAGRIFGEYFNKNTIPFDKVKVHYDPRDVTSGQHRN